MPFCTNCGAEVTGTKFCGQCGTPTGASSAGAEPSPSSPPGTHPRGEGSSGDLGIPDNTAAALCYFLLPAAVFLVIEPYRDNRYIRFHCFQAIFSAAVVLLTLGIITTIVSAIIGVLAFVLAWLLVLASFVYGIKLVLRIYAGEDVKIPIISDFAERYA